MKEIYSNGDDCAWLARQLKTQMGKYVSFNRFGIDNPILTGVYDKNGLGVLCYSKEAVRFFIKFCRGEFLRIQIELSSNKNENEISAMNELIKALASIKQGDTPIGYPIAIYKTDNCLTGEYAFNNQKEVIQKLKNNTMFDDGDIDDLRFLRTCHDYGYEPSEFEEESKDDALYCIDACSTQTQDINKESTEEEKPNIILLCKSVCDKK